MTWREYEIFCDTVLRKIFPDSRFKIKQNYTKVYNGELKKMDFHIAERRRGGYSWVVDCKHFGKVALPVNEILTTLEYKRLCRASRAILVVSEHTKISDTARYVADLKNVPIWPLSSDITAWGVFWKRFVERRQLIGM